MHIIIYILDILMNLIAGLFTYLGQSDYLLGQFLHHFILYEPNQLPEIKDTLLILGISALVIPNTIRLKRLKRKNNSLLSQNKAMTTQLRGYLITALEDHTDIRNCNFKIRIFTPNEPRIRNFFKRKNKKVKYFKIRHIEGLTDDDNLEKLKFQVAPKIQGLVGQCYKERKIAYDEELSVTNETRYNLDNFHKSKTNNFSFCACVPIYTDKDVIIAILAIDTNTEIKIESPHYFFTCLNTFACDLEKQLQAQFF